MKTLKQNMKRGRPDIIHFALLEALGSPLNKESLLQTYVHTINNYVIALNPQTRLPRNYSRFLGLMEQLFEVGKVPPKGTVLLTLEHKTLPQLIRELKPSYVLAFSRIGTLKTLEETISKLTSEKRPAILVGGFSHGHFTNSTLKLADELFAWTQKCWKHGLWPRESFTSMNEPFPFQTKDLKSANQLFSPHRARMF